MKKLTFFVLILTMAIPSFSQQKKPLDHTVYDHWKDLGHQIVSDNGAFVSYEINPQQGDGWLYVYDVKKNRLDSLPRGHKAHFMPDGKVLVYTIKPQFEKVLHLKRKKTKKDKLPSDSLALYSTEFGLWKKFGQVQNVEVPKTTSQWIAVLMKKKTPAKKDKEKGKDVSSKKKTKKLKKPQGAVLMLYNVSSGDSAGFDHVTHFTLSKNGKTCLFSIVPRDTVDKVVVMTFSTITQKADTLYASKAFVKNVALDENGEQAAFTFSQDTVKNKAYGLFYADLKKDKKIRVSGMNFSNLPKGWSVSTHGDIYFNKTGTELYFGTAPRPLPPLKDTLAPAEKVSLDIWTYHDTLLQPQQKVQLKREKNRSYTAVFFPKDNHLEQLAHPAMKEIQIKPRAKGDYSLGFDNRPYLKMTSWIGQWYSDVYLVNRKTGERKLIIPKVAYGVGISPGQQFVSWYNLQDSAWYAYNVKTAKSVCVTGKINVPLYNVLNDVPNMAPPYGMAGWTKNEKMVIYGRYDLWLVDPLGKEPPVNLTSGTGRKENLRFRYVKLDKEAQTLPDKMLLSAFQLKNKKAGFYALNLKNRKPAKLVLDDYAYNHPLKAKKAPEIIWRKESFRLYPDLYVSNLRFSNVRKVSNANPQQKNYRWGTVGLVHWVTFNGDTMQGLLYKPANFNPNKKYPMLVYFYERYSDRLHRYYSPRPIRSVINFSYYASNGYLIFVPDIKYKVGHPGASAYDCVISGTQAMANRFPFIDRSRLGMQGQSWGGYQSAYLVTQTNLFRCADEKDLTRRFQQFFDFYLKDAPEPEWMKKGIPAVDKNRDYGFKLEQ